MMKLIKLIVLGFTMFLSFSAIAADGMKPGQWEITVKNDQMMAMPAMSPAEMAEMKKMGMNMPAMDKSGMHVKSCVTPEQASPEKFAQQDKDCKMQNFKHSGNKTSADMTCTGEMKATGRFEMTMQSSTAYTSLTTMKGVSSDGETINQKIVTVGKWSKAKCDADALSNGKR